MWAAFCFFPNSVSLESSAIVKVPEQVGAAKSAPRKVGNQVPRKVPPFPRDSQARVPRFPRTGSQNRFPGTSSSSRFPRGSFPQARFPGRGSQARFPSKVPRNRFPSKVHRQGSQEEVPKQGLLPRNHTCQQPRSQKQQPEKPSS